MKTASLWIRGGIAVGIIWLEYIALEKGVPALTALATALVAGAAVIASIKNKLE